MDYKNMMGVMVSFVTLEAGFLRWLFCCVVMKAYGFGLQGAVVIG